MKPYRHQHRDDTPAGCSRCDKADNFVAAYPLYPMGPLVMFHPWCQPCYRLRSTRRGDE